MVFRILVLASTLAIQGRGPDTRPDGLGEMLRQHVLWLQSEGKQGVRADLRGMDLENHPPRPTGGIPSVAPLLSAGVVLRGADLRKADMRFARLRGVDLTEAHLQYARLNQTDLRRTALVGADLEYTDFSNANLAGADLRGANLNGAVFSGADLTAADLTGTKCLAREQLADSRSDGDTKLPPFEDCGQPR